MSRIALWPFALLCLAGCATQQTPSASGSKENEEPPQITSETLQAMLAERNKGSKVIRGNPCPDFSYTTMDGRIVKLADYRGRAVIVDIFSPT